jgi:excisionase family DNA binding protein
VSSDDAVTSHDEGGLVTRADAARKLGVSPSTVKRLVKSGSLTEVEVGPRARRIDPDALTAFIESRSRGRTE